MALPFPPRLPPWQHLAVLLCLLISPFNTGCVRRISYASPDGRRVEVLNVGFDTTLATLHAETADGRVTIEGADSRATVAARLADLAVELAKKGGRP